ncbi:phosphate acetyltransferase [Algoriphagus boritolerans]|uniref:Phosphate acetyltransferase n=1 Tax=Algoriphagus boritolerans DSM 17298 = JCM 18970 TaxID=1120964 RepID=A0A1H5S7L0_9BACT|nr:phosphate acetyltransferase [Algoriphagus boritolerans]SEF45807.1 phosphate acetyltransferase [Algoriphagus boritolerans DSM 17298 = JCM 18970]
MTNAIYLTTTEPFSGKSIYALGLVNLLAGKTDKISYFKPIITVGKKEKDRRLTLIKEHFKLAQAYEDMFSFTIQKAFKEINRNNEAFLIDAIIEKFKRLQESSDFVVVEGTDFAGFSSNVEFNGNVSIAKNLGIPAAIILNCSHKSDVEIVEQAISTTNAFLSNGVQVLTLVANKVEQGKETELLKKLTQALPKEILISAIPVHLELSNPTMEEIRDAMGAKVFFGENLLTNRVDHVIVGAMQLRNFLQRVKNNTLVITPGDRGDIIIGALQANISKNFGKIAGLVLSGGMLPEDSIVQLVEGLETVVPILQVEEATFEVVTKINDIKARISADDKEKIAIGIGLFEQAVDEKALTAKLVGFHSDVLTPRMFQYQLVKRAKSNKKHIVLPEGEDDRILQAADQLIKQNVVELTILGNREFIELTVKRLNLSLDLDAVKIEAPVSSIRFEEYAQTLFELRKSKGLTIEMARDLMLDVSYFGTMMVFKGHADGMVSGAVHTTQHTIRPALQFVKTKPGVATVSSVFFMCLPNRVSVFGDCAVVPNPTSEQLADIAISSAESAKMLGIEPKIAMLSYSSGSSGEGEDVEKVRKATQLVRIRRPELKVEGPIQYDAAVDPEVGRKKMPDSEVAGQASVLIFPDLNTGNNTYKAVQRETGAIAIGPMLQGLNKPVNDLSRGCTVVDVFNTVVITAIQAQET